MTETLLQQSNILDKTLSLHEEIISSPIIIRAPLTSADSYYRSIVTAVYGNLNLLVSAAAALITINNRLKFCHAYQDIANLYQQLIHEVKAFETKAQHSNYRAELILAARYLLCATIDETIMNTEWGQRQEWHQRLLSTFQHGENPSERFFIILQRISEDPTHHIDLLELAYLCLSFGFEGKYRQLQNKHELEQLTDNLFQQIRRQREELKPILQTNIVVSPTAIKNKSWSLKTKHLLITLLAVIGLISGGFIFSLSHYASKVSAQLYNLLAS